MTYRYVDAAGGLVHEVVRKPDKQGFFQRRPDPDHPGKWINNLDGIERVPYRLPELLDAAGKSGDVFVVEGEKDADRLATSGHVATTSPQGCGGSSWTPGFVAHFKGSGTVYVLCDDDKPGRAAGRLRAQLLAGVVPDVRLVERLPGGDGGDGYDVSDFLDGSGTLEQLWKIAQAGEQVPRPEETRSRPGESRDLGSTSTGGYRTDESGTYGRDGAPLANFWARITADVIVDDGAEPGRRLEIEAFVRGKVHRFTIPADQLRDIHRWTPTALGPEAVIYPGRSGADHLVVAIQEASFGMPTRHVYCHTGWRQIDGDRVYLHAGGAIGVSGSVGGIETELDGDLASFRLPTPPRGDLLIACVRSSLKLLDIGPDPMTVPLLAAVFRAPLCRCDFGVFFVGSTGTFKSELAARAQQHFGSGFVPNNGKPQFPQNWGSTPNAIRETLFLAKDCLVVVDDFKPEGTKQDIDRMHKAAADVFRSVGNGSGRGRLDRNAKPRPERKPRCLMIGTGEDLPRGESVRGRFIVVGVETGEITSERLTEAQKVGQRGDYASCMAAYLEWLAMDYEKRTQRSEQLRAELLDALELHGVHRRTPRSVASLGSGFLLFLDFALELGAITDSELAEFRRRARDGLSIVASHQRDHQLEEQPARRFLVALAAVIRSGRAHLESVNGGAPDNDLRGQLGWKRSELPTGWEPLGTRVGWVDGEHAYLDRENALREASDFASKTQGPIGLSSKSLGAELKRSGLLAAMTESRGNVVRKRVPGAGRMDLWAVPIAAITESGCMDAEFTGPTGPANGTVG